MIISLIWLGHLSLLWMLGFTPNGEYFIFPYLASAGWLPYRQIIDHHTPGLWLLPVNFATLGFASPGAFKILLLLLVLAQSVLLFVIARKLFSYKTAVLAVVAYALWQPFFAGTNLWPDLFLPLFILPAFYFYHRKNWLYTGIFLGLGMLFKQSAALLLLIPLVSLRHLPGKLKNLLDYVFGLALPWIPALLYLWLHHLIPDFLYWTVWFNLTGYAAGARLLPGITDLIKISLPVILFFSAWLYTRKHRPEADGIFSWGLAAVIAGFTRFHLKYFQPAVPFFCLLLAMFIGYLRDSGKRRMVLAVIILNLVWFTGFIVTRKDWLQTDYFDSQTLELVRRVKILTDPGDHIFLLGVQPHVYTLTATYPSGKYFVYQLPWLIRSTQTGMMYGLLSDPPKLVIYNTQNRIDGRTITDFAPQLLEYTQALYVPSEYIGRYIIYSPKTQ